VLSHGWGLNSDEWVYAVRELSSRFRLITWDEPGLGRSSRPRNRDFSLEKLANDLKAVLDASTRSPATLLGHSIGGMIILTFCRIFPEALGKEVSGLILSHTTYTNPVRTTKGAGFYTAIEKLDNSLLEAAADLGCRPVKAFFRITVPLTKPGIIAGCMLVFIPAVGEFVIPALLGGPDSLMIGRVLWEEFFNNRDWPVASAVAIVMLFLLVIPIMVFQHFQGQQLGAHR
jgi:ABC-type spermidine/putrescine transport system permease subunit II